MEFRRLGGSGLAVSVAGLGCNNFGMRIDAQGTDAVVHAALDLGVTLFDTADIYGGRGTSEELLGRALGSRRDEVVVATKFANPMGDGPYLRGASRRYITRAVEASLRRLGTDRIDLYQQHVPDPATPIDETLEALDDLVAAGKVLYVGSSNFTGWQVAEADHVARGAGRRALRHRPERVEPVEPAGRARAGSGLRALRHQPAAVLPAGQRPAHRQVPARRAAHPKAPGWPPGGAGA